MNSHKKAILLNWERLRIGYNAILFAGALWALHGHVVAVFAQYWRFVVLFAMGANISYLLGPLSEIYARYLLGLRAEQPRYRFLLAGLRCLLFSAGLALSIWLVLDAARIAVFEYNSSGRYEP